MQAASDRRKNTFLIIASSGWICAALFTFCLSQHLPAQAGKHPRPALRLESRIPLSNVQGRIDHMSIDVAGGRLFVSALGNDTVEVINVKNSQRIHTISDLAEPQGVLFVASANRLFVANARDGSVHIFDGGTLAPIKVISYGNDADNIRYDSGNGHIWVGYGDGALGELDKDGNKIGDIRLDAHPESFQLEKSGNRIFVNLPDSRKLAVVNRESRQINAEWHTGGPQANFPMAFDEPDHRLFVVCRRPARLIVINTDTGQVVASVPAVGDCDDLFYDSKRRHLYAIGGEGAISVFQQTDSDHCSEIARITTVPGARTGFYSPDFDRLYVAVRRQGNHAAELRVYSPQDR